MWRCPICGETEPIEFQVGHMATHGRKAEYLNDEPGTMPLFVDIRPIEGPLTVDQTRFVERMGDMLLAHPDEYFRSSGRVDGLDDWAAELVY